MVEGRAEMKGRENGRRRRGRKGECGKDRKMKEERK